MLRSQRGIKSPLGIKGKKDASDAAIGWWWFDANIPFNMQQCKIFFLQLMAYAISSIGSGYKISSYHDLCGQILRKTIIKAKISWSIIRDVVVKLGAPPWLMGRQMKGIEHL